VRSLCSEIWNRDVPRGLDAYSLPARVVPVAVVFLAPLVLFGAGIVTGLSRLIASGLVLTVVGAIAAQLGRDRGKRLEPGLWRQWGGSATLRRLRYRDGGDSGVVARLHRRIEAVLGDALPSQDEETADPAASDARYEEATRRLIGRTRDRTLFDLLFRENVNYGQRRNLLGLKPIGILVALATGAVCVGLALTGSGAFSHQAARYGPAFTVAALELLFWLLVVSPNWVRIPAEAYADRLIEAVDTLSPSAPAAES